MIMTHKKPPLWKQLLGAVVGGSLALVIYGGYKMAAPTLGAYITIPDLGIYSGSSQPVRTAARSIDEEKLDRISQRAVEISETYNARVNNEQPDYDIRLEDEMNADSQIAYADEGPVWEDKVQEDWWNTQQDWAAAEQGSAPRPSYHVASSVVSSDASVLHADIASATTSRDTTTYVPYDGASSLPNSGIGTNLAALAALIGTGAYVCMRRRRNLA